MERLTIVKGTLDLLVLKTLAWGAMHGFEVVAWIEEHTANGLELDDAAIYQALYRLENRGLLRVELGLTENNRKARYYELTAKGRDHLKRETSRWLRYTDIVNGVLTLPAPRGAKS